MEWLKVDDPVGCFPVHGIAGVWSLICVGLFSENVPVVDGEIKSNTKGLFKGGRYTFLGAQILACICIIVWAMVSTILEVRNKLNRIASYIMHLHYPES